MLGLSCQIKREPISLCIQGTIDGERFLNECLCSAEFVLVWPASLVFVTVLLGVHLTLSGENASECLLTIRRAPMQAHIVT